MRDTQGNGVFAISSAATDEVESQAVGEPCVPFWVSGFVNARRPIKFRYLYSALPSQMLSAAGPPDELPTIVTAEEQTDVHTRDDSLTGLTRIHESRIDSAC